MQKDSTGENNSTELYELGFLIVPSIAEDVVSEEASKLLTIITKHGGVIKATENPALRGLAYTMTQHVSGKNVPYDTAYFGSFVFECEANNVSHIQKEVDKISSVLRSLVIETEAAALLPRERKVIGKIEPEKFRPEKPAVPVVPVSEEELDKTIEELVVQ